MNIMASADIRLKYNEVVEKCKESGQPIYLTKNGRGDLVVLDIATYEREKQLLAAQKLVLEAYASKLSGSKSYSNEEALAHLDKLIKDNI